MASYSRAQEERIWAFGNSKADNDEQWESLARSMRRTNQGLRLKFFKMKECLKKTGSPFAPGRQARTAPVITKAKAKAKRVSRSRTPRSPSPGPAAAAFVSAPAFTAVNAPATAPVKSDTVKSGTLPPIRDVVGFDKRRYQAAIALMELRDQEVLRLPPVRASSPELEAVKASWKEVQDDMYRVWVRCGGHGPSLLDIASRLRM